MSTGLLVIVTSIPLLLSLIAWGFVSSRARRRAQATALAQLGLLPCPEKKAWLEATVADIENGARNRFEVRDPRRLPGEPAVYYYVKVSHNEHNRSPVTEEEILFPLKRPSVDPLILTVKPRALKRGLRSRWLATAGAIRWAGQPADLQRIDLPRDLRNSAVTGILGPAGSRLYDHIGSGVLRVLQGLGDAGGLTVRMRGAWCVVGAGRQIPLRVADVIARLRPLL
ncbi:MAG: hypothetical protein ACREMA_04725 [Longimicrobiales bacterium]